VPQQDASTGQLVAAALTSNEVDDTVQVGPLIDQITCTAALSNAAAPT
jgi:hypothetical protein